DVRAGRGEGGARRRRGGATGARPRRRAEPAARGGDRRARARDAALRRVPAQVDAADPGHRDGRRRAASGRGGGRDSELVLTHSLVQGMAQGRRPAEATITTYGLRLTGGLT